MTTAENLLARLDRIPIWPYRYSLLFIVGIGTLFAFFDIVTIAVALPVIVKEFHTTNATAVWCITTSLIGYIVGAILDSRISDCVGRRLALFLSVSFFSIGSLLSALSPNLATLMIARFIVGMGIGAEIPNIMAYIGELSPARCRGRYSSFVVALGFMGFALVPFVALLMVPNFAWGWRLLFFIGGIGGIILFFMRRTMPQSARWLISHGHIEEAEQSINAAEQLAIQRLKTTLPEYKTEISSPHTTESTLLTLLKPPYLYQIFLFASTWVIYYIGNYGWLTLNTTLLDIRGFKLSHSIILVALSSLGFIVGGLLSILFSEKIERKWSCILIALCWAFDLFAMGWLAKSDLSLVILGFIAATSIAFLVPLLYAYTAENFPTRFRATGVALTDGFGHLGGAFCGQIVLGIAAFYKPTGYEFQAALTVMGITGLLTAFILLFGKHMNGKTLEQ